MKRKITAIFITLVALLMLCLSACGKVEFKVNFVVDGEIYATVDTNGNEVIKMPENPTKEGYSFDGWYWDKDEWEKPFTANSLLDAPLSSDMSVYAKFVSNEVPPTQDFVVNALKTMPNIVAVSAATEYNDPNGQLNKPGGYIADIFFSVDVINQNLITGTTLVEKGTDAGGSIEIYRTQKDAEKRNEYLASFDGGILSSGSHKVIGTCVVRTSDALTASLQNILENNIEKALTGSTEAFVSMDTYLIEIAKQVAEEEKLSEFEVGTKLIEFGYPLEKAEAVAEICGANFNEIAKGLAEGYADYYATVYPTMIAELLADHEFTEANIEYVLENADIDWQFYAKIHARDFVNMNEEEYYISPLDVIVYLNNDKGYTVEDSEYGVWNCEVNWNEKAIEYIECIEADGILGPKGDYITALTDMEFTQAQAEYAVNNCGNNWNNHALLCLKHFVEDLSTTTPNHAECLAKLKDWGFSDSEANYAIGNYDGLIYPDKLDYVIHFNPDGGELSSLTQNVVFGKTYTLPTPTKTGYTFKGWYNGTTEVTAGTWYTANNVTLKAKWEETKYNITYVLDGGSNNSGNPATYTTSQSVTLLAPTKTGYTFIGWKASGSSTAVYSPTIAVGSTGNKTYTAVWQINQYTITFNTDGGSEVASITQNYGTSIVKPSNPTKTGYSFTGWDKTIPSTMPAKDITITAKWEIEQFTITFNTNGGTSIAPIKQQYGTVIVEPSNPTRTGYTFAGWDKEIPSTMPAEDTTITAKWTANTYKVTFVANGGSCDTTSLTATYDSSLTLPTPTRVGYTFSGWYNGSTKYTTGTWKTASAITLTAKWTANTYTLSYNVNGGTLSSTTQTVTYDSSYTLRTPTRTGYTFLGWYNGEDKVENGTWKLTSGLTVKAKWQANTYKVTFSANGGSCDTTSLTATYDSSLTLPTPTRVGYTFSGWYNGSTKYTTGTWKTASNTTLTAKWTARTDIAYVVNHYQQNITDNEYTLFETQNLKGTADASIKPATNSYTGFTAPTKQTVTIKPDGSLVVNYYYTRNSYTITFVTNGGDSVAKITQKYQSNLTLPVTVKEGLTFGGWYSHPGLKSSDCFTSSTMLSSNCTLYACWQEENSPYDFEYDDDLSIISKYVGTSATIWIPSHIGGVEVTTISTSAFVNNTTVTKVVIPNTVTFIGANVLKGCSSLIDITIPFVGETGVDDGISKSALGYLFGYQEGKNEALTSSGSTYQGYNQNYTVGVQGATGTHYYCYLIPTTLRTVTITKQISIPTNAFRNCDMLETINIVSQGNSIGSYAFYNCSALRTCTIPMSVTTIGTYAFYNCSSLMSLNSDTTGVVVLPNGVERIEDYTFTKCVLVDSIYLSDNVEYIGKYAFAGVDLAQMNSERDYEIIIPNSCKTIESYAFSGSKQAKYFVMPNATTKIGLSALYNCSGIEELTIPFVPTEEVVYDYIIGLGSIFNYWYDGSGYDMTVPDGMYDTQSYYSGGYTSGGTVGNKHYSVPSSLVKVTVTGSLVIPENAFCGMKNLQEVTVLGESVAIKSKAFYNCSSLETLNLPNDVTVESDSLTNSGILKKAGVVYLGTILYKYNGTMPSGYTLNVKSGTTEIQANAFSGCAGLTKVILPTSLKTIGAGAFNGCSSLTMVEIPSSVESIGAGAFEGCSQLTEITIPFIGSNANSNGTFSYIFSTVPTTLTKVTVTGDVNVPDNAFKGRTKLQTIIFTGKVETIAANAFYGCSALTTVTLPNTVKAVGNYAFYGCGKLTAIDLASMTALNSIGSYAFQNCTSITSVVVPESVTTIGDYTFSGCTKLTTVSLSSKITSIGNYAFNGCTSLATVTLNSNVMESIGAYAFQNCSALTTIYIPSSVTYIGEYTFNSCTNLTINCEATSMPADWDYNWNPSNCSVNWGITQ